MFGFQGAKVFNKILDKLKNETSFVKLKSGCKEFD